MVLGLKTISFNIFVFTFPFLVIIPSNFLASFLPWLLLLRIFLSFIYFQTLHSLLFTFLHRLHVYRYIDTFLSTFFSNIFNKLLSDFRGLYVSYSYIVSNLFELSNLWTASVWILTFISLHISFCKIISASRYLNCCIILNLRFLTFCYFYCVFSIFISNLMLCAASINFFDWF